MDPSNTFEWLLQEGMDLLRPLAEAFDDERGASWFLALVGVGLDSDGGPDLVHAMEGLRDPLNRLQARLDSASTPLSYEAASEAASELDRVVKALVRVDVESTATSERSVGAAILDHLLVTHLWSNRPFVASALSIAGIVPNYDGERPFVVDWERLSLVLQNHEGSFDDLDMGTERTFRFLAGLRKLARAAGLSTTWSPSDDLQPLQLARGYRFKLPALRLIPFHRVSEDGLIGAGIALQTFTREGDGGSEGLLVVPVALGSGEEEIGLSEQWILSLAVAGDVAQPYAVELTSDAVRVLRVSDTQALADLVVSVRAKNAGSSAQTISLTDGTSRSLQGQIEELRFDYALSEDVTIGARLRFTMHLSGEVFDGFLRSIMPRDSIEAGFAPTVEWSNRQGLSFRGSPDLNVAIPLHSSLGALDVHEVNLAVGLGDEITLGASASIGAALGPIHVTVEGVGITAALKVPGDVTALQASGLVELEARPPTRIALSLDGRIEGTGLLHFEHAKNLYSGHLSLNAGDIGFNALGLITSETQDPTLGFSMLVILHATFDPAIQLPLGFTLSAVGGLVGVNRSMSTEALRKGVKQRTLDSILFPEPEWVVVNSDKILSDMQAVFPSREGHHVVGPMVKIGHGTPNTVVGDVGVFLEFAGARLLRLALLGQLEAHLPQPDKPILILHLDVVGVADLEKKELSLQATLYDSRILEYDLSGDGAFLLSWGPQPAFALALGGFHPKFTPPPPPLVFANLKRLNLSLDRGSRFQLSCAVYQALTPNTLQFGARAELNAKLSGARVNGRLAFDTLIYFSPFSFDVDVRAGISVRYKGKSFADIRIALTLSGPTPWNVRGTAKIKVMFFSFKVRFRLTWGRKNAALLDPVDPWLPLEQALHRPESWGSRLPPSTSVVAALRDIGADDVAAATDSEHPGTRPRPVVVHPSGTVEVRQSVAPLDTPLGKFGNAPIKEHDRFRISKVSAGDMELAHEPLNEHFARAQFEELSTDQRLSLPSFERMPGGIGITATHRWKLHGGVRTVLVQYETIPEPQAHSELANESEGAVDGPKRALAVADWRRARRLLRGNASKRSVLRSKGKARFAHPGAELVGTVDERYAIVKADTLTRSEVGAGWMTRMQADHALSEYLRKHPERQGTLLVVPEWEAEGEEAA